MLGRTIIHHPIGELTGPNTKDKWLGWPCCAACVLVVVALVAYLLLLADFTVVWLVNPPLRVVDAPMKCLGPHSFLLGFIVLGRDLLPFLVLFLQLFVQSVFLVPSSSSSLVLIFDYFHLFAEHVGSIGLLLFDPALAC